MMNRIARKTRLSLIAVAGCLIASSTLNAQERDAMTAADENLRLEFANGIAAIAEGKIITVDDIRREIAPLVPQIQRESRNEQEFNQRLEALQDTTIQSLVDRVLIVKDFFSDEKRRIPPSFVDNAVDENIINQFEGDRSKFLAYLRARGLTTRDYRREVEEEIIYNYMRQQKRKSATIVSPVQVQTFYDENREEFYQEDSVHLRLIQLARREGESDAGLLRGAAEVQARLDVGQKFEDIAKELSTDSRRSRGGDWGWQNRSDLKPEFSDPLFELAKGEATAPIVLEEGVYILYAEDRKYAGIRPIDEVRDIIEDIIVRREGRETLDVWLERLRRTAFVKLY